MDVIDARAALTGAGFVDLASGPLRVVEGGWASWTFAAGLDAAWIVRFPRTPEVADAARRELRLLPALARRLPVAVPVPTHVGVHRSWPFFAYRRIPGRPARTTDGRPGFVSEVGEALAALHATPLAEATELLGNPAATPAAWWLRYERLWRMVERDVLPHADPRLRTAVTTAYWSMVDGAAAFAPVLVHGDLAPEHILVDDTGGLAGLIDFEDAAVGDPLIDLVAPARLFGRRQALEMLATHRDLGPVPEARLAFYTWVAELHQVIHGSRHNAPAEIHAGLTGLRRHLL